MSESVVVVFVNGWVQLAFCSLLILFIVLHIVATIEKAKAAKRLDELAKKLKEDAIGAKR